MIQIQTVIDWLHTYAPLEGVRLNVDSLETDADSMAVFSDPTFTEIRRYVSGERVLRQQFTLQSRAFYGSDPVQNGENLDWFAAFAAWVRQQNLKEQYPAIPGGEITRLETADAPYPVVIASDGQSARYQIEIQITYVERND